MNRPDELKLLLTPEQRQQVLDYMYRGWNCEPDDYILDGYGVVFFNGEDKIRLCGSKEMVENENWRTIKERKVVEYSDYSEYSIRVVGNYTFEEFMDEYLSIRPLHRGCVIVRDLRMPLDNSKIDCDIPDNLKGCKVMSAFLKYDYLCSLHVYVDGFKGREFPVKPTKKGLSLFKEIGTALESVKNDKLKEEDNG